MISIIISSYQPTFFAALEKNIAETIGVPYEIVQIYNPGTMGICEAYNKGAAKANFEQLLFLHEDVLFETQNWGAILCNQMQQGNVGVIGVAGCSYVPNVPFAWWDLFPASFKNLKQYNKNRLVSQFSLKDDKTVMALDGVFLACRKEIWRKFPFNEKISGFHGYDIDFSVRVAYDYDNIVTSKIIISHFSMGNMDEKWLRSLIETRGYFKKPKGQMINKKYEYFYYTKLKTYLEQFNFPDTEKGMILNKYNNPRYIGYKAFLKNLTS
ncbi:glycosyltransferase [uncultured Chryseobacterium sp.]|uniref:glycosyltransferase n=1 Tax=uncultured Chryseobacterium sp. TaxID=259322 RepID=UPI00262DA725|nr:glycosyltransferase [uncultured Chryseobacterium sp.]